MTRHQGAQAALPMHMLRAPAESDSLRNPRGSIPFTLALLRHRERTREQLGEEHASRFVGRNVDTTRMLRHLTRLGHIVEDDQGLVGITREGEKWLEGQTHKAVSTKPPKVRTVVRNPYQPSPEVQPAAWIPAATGGRAHPSSDADNRPAPMRPGSEQAMGLPSRIGDRLHYRSGLITDMAGAVLQPATRGAQLYQPTRNGEKRAKPVYPSNH